MVEFTQGLLAGFELVDRMRDRAQNQQLQKERIGLARAADQRAENIYRSDQEQVARTNIRQDRTDQSNQVLARISEVGVNGLTDAERVQARKAAAYNPGIAQAFEEEQLNQRDVTAIQGLQRPRGLGNIVTQQTAPQSAQSQSGQVAAEPVTPEQFVSSDGEGLPPPQGQGVRPVNVHLLSNKIGIGADQLAESLTPNTPGNSQFFDVPEEFMQQVEAADSLPVVQREAAMKDLREQVTGLREQTSYARQAQVMAQDGVKVWQDFVNPDARGGSALREMAGTDPSLITNKLHSDWNTIKNTDPNLIGTLSRELSPVVQETVMNTGAAISQLPLDANGNIDASTQEAKNLYRDFNNAIELQQQMSDTWTGAFEAKIRDSSMPIGNAELSADLAASLAETPRPGTQASAGQRTANMTLAQRAVQQVAGGNSRTLSTRQVESLAWMAKRGYITPGGFQQFLETGTFSDPKDAEFFDHDPDKILYYTDPNTGETEIKWMPPGAGASTPSDQFDAGQLDYLQKNVFVDPTGTDQGNAHMRRVQNEFLVTLQRNPEALGMIGLSSEDISNLSPQDTALLGERFMALKQTESAWEDSFWSFNWVPTVDRKLTDQVDDDNQPIGFRNFDDIARDFDIDPFTLPQGQADTRSARMQLATSDDSHDRQQARILSEQELANAILEAKAAAVNPQR